MTLSFFFKYTLLKRWKSLLSAALANVNRKGSIQRRTSFSPHNISDFVWISGFSFRGAFSGTLVMLAVFVASSV